MIIEYLFTMWADLFMAGYRPANPKPVPETWLEYVERARITVDNYLKEKNDGRR